MTTPDASTVTRDALHDAEPVGAHSLGSSRRPRLRLNVAPGIHQLEHEDNRLTYPLTYPAARPILASMTRAGALSVKGITGTINLPPSGVIDVPGQPRVVFSPGHTAGHTALHLPDRDALLTGDALVTLDPYTATTGPQIVAGAATADSRAAGASLEALAVTDARIVLPGHGRPWTSNIRTAVNLALSVGVT
ncbi:MAG: fold metallo-hydrolase [Subtercola sp.]|nr:fold metallo-hydrolase [Subtercola sp.]